MICCIAVSNNRAMNPQIDWREVKVGGECIGALSDTFLERDVMQIATNWYATYFLSFFDKPVFPKNKGCCGYDDSYDGTYRVNSYGEILRIWLNNGRHFKDRLYKEIVAHHANIAEFTFSPLGYFVATYSHYDYYDPKIKVWDIATGDCLKELNVDNAFRSITWRELLGEDMIFSLAGKLCPNLNSLQRIHERMTGKAALIRINN